MLGSKVYPLSNWARRKICSFFNLMVLQCLLVCFIAFSDDMKGHICVKTAISLSVKPMKLKSERNVDGRNHEAWSLVGKGR